MYPYLGFENSALVERTRRPVPAREARTFHWAISEQIRDLPTGALVRAEFTE